MLRFSSIAPLDTPVVPPVYCRNAMSPGLISTRSSVMRAPAAQHRVEAQRTVERIGRHHLLDVAHDEIDQRAFQSAEHVAHRRDHDMLHRRPGDHLFQRVREVLQDHDRLRARVLELVFELARRIQRIHVHHHQAGAQHAEQSHGILQHVGHHQRDAVALLQPLRLQPGAESPATGDSSSPKVISAPMQW